MGADKFETGSWRLTHLRHGRPQLYPALRLESSVSFRQPTTERQSALPHARKVKIKSFQQQLQVCYCDAVEHAYGYPKGSRRRAHWKEETCHDNYNYGVSVFSQ